MKITTSEETKDEVIFKYVFNSAIRLLKLTGYYLGQERATWRKYGLILLTIIYKLVVVYNCFRYGGLFVGETELSGTLTSALAMMTFYLFQAYVILALTFSLPLNFWKLLELLRLYITDYGAASYLKTLRRKLAKLGLTSTIAYLTFIIVFTVSVNNLFPTVRRHMAPFDQGIGYHRIMFLVLYIILMVLVCSQVLPVFVVLNCITVILWKEFDILCKKLQEEISSIEDKFDQFCQRHERLCTITKQANKILSHVVFATYTFGIPMLCFLSYGMIKGSLPLDELLFCSGNLFTVVLLMIWVTALACAVNEKAHEPAQYIFQSDWSTLSSKTLHKISLFIARLSMEKIGYTVYGLFTVDRSTILMICGTIVTYVVVVLQIQTGSGQGCVHTCPSLTNLNLTALCQN